MHLEAATFSRDPADPAANEDAIVVLPGRAYAVIDGVSDRSGIRYDGELSGRHAARLVAATLERLLLGPPPPPESIVPTLTATLHEAYLRHGTLVAAEANWGARLCCTLALALHDGPRLHLILAGDSGIRLNGEDILQATKDLDHVTATLRSHAWHAGPDPDPIARDRHARRVTWHGTAQSADLATLEAAAQAECAASLPHIPRADLAHLIRHGIVGAQGDYQNNPESILGYACLDGFSIPRTLLRITTLDAGTIDTLELFTDGYFRPGDRTSLAAWEQAHAQVEAEDPAKVGKYRSTKGSTPGRWADDRSYIMVAPG